MPLFRQLLWYLVCYITTCKSDQALVRPSIRYTFRSHFRWPKKCFWVEPNKSETSIRLAGASRTLILAKLSLQIVWIMIVYFQWLIYIIDWQTEWRDYSQLSANYTLIYILFVCISPYNRRGNKDRKIRLLQFDPSNLLTSFLFMNNSLLLLIFIMWSFLRCPFVRSHLGL
jgi:hypothetical protein